MDENHPTSNPANTRCSEYAGLRLAHRLRRCANIKPSWDLMFSRGKSTHSCATQKGSVLIFNVHPSRDTPGAPNLADEVTEGPLSHRNQQGIFQASNAGIVMANMAGVGQPAIFGGQI